MKSVRSSNVSRNYRKESRARTPPESSQNQVHSLKLEPKRSSISLGYRFSKVVAEKRSTRSKSLDLDLPMFDGKNPDCWIVKADLFFGHDEDEAKLDLVYFPLLRRRCLEMVHARDA
ncbi:hypothetical protein F2Q68_00001175 [Brassica cretica]|uniref:Uncharacterized protein n=1 Tax=Brassica cretica TaxID=69181 RepID=A0A8S9JDP8_BRACR|nr:hypothetical protein F2Q68_00001175 [Brassica cretica]